MRAHRLLRLLAIAARKQACGRSRTSARTQLRAWRGVVLELRRRAVLRRSVACIPRASPDRAAGPRTRREGAGGLAEPPALTHRRSSVTSHDEWPSGVDPDLLRCARSNGRSRLPSSYRLDDPDGGRRAP